ncbi:serine aminopeptidase domain-containing protein [Candidatus Omnitrophota bacterium]
MKIDRYSGTIVTIPCGKHSVSARYFHIATSKKHLEEKPVILRLHGTLGNLLDETEYFLPGILAQEGYSSITMNTLLSNLGLFFGYGIFDSVMPQIDAVCQFLRDVGFKRIIIAGHGLGSCMAIRYASLRNDRTKYPDIAGLISIATPYSLPETVRRKWARFGSEPSYDEVCRRSKLCCKPDPGKNALNDEIVLIKKAHGNTCKPEDTEIYTLKTWWALAGPEADGTKVHKHIGEIKIPMLLIHGLHDDIIDHSELKRLGHIAKETGNNDVTMCALKADHRIDGKHDELAGIIIDWLIRKFE